ncbi:SPFH domain-containing protein [Anaerobium acetethylicum]|uniref:SPFH domain / Band 7 family protein n=1 Tax=Anaerobium acetethylicum TaxID=1619234 RepID=A0A1D3TYP6_9FIRM|nr:SPFH domain-containing protein [Anaerobium acetethylicum]SCP99625.1 SPFH domain / Band 7 family protein [Anaerobium acetethylicum]
MFNIKFIKFLPSEYVLRYKKGKIVEEGAGISFFYYAPVTSAVVIPIASADVPFVFEEVTNDYQTVTVQGQITYRITDYRKIAEVMDFTYDMRNKKYVNDNSQKIAQRLVNISKVLTKKHIENIQLRDAIRSSEKLANHIMNELCEINEIKNLGIEVMGFSVLAILPNKETARALEAQAREEILRKADEALYERRNASIEQERKVKENELNTEIAVEEKKKQIKETQLEAKRLVMQKENQIKEEELGFETELEEKKKQLVGLSVENAKAQADAKAYELSVMMKAFSGIDATVMQSLANMGMKPDKLIAIAFQELADKADKIGQLNITPDLLQGLLERRDK